MDKTLQDLAWRCLPREVKEEVKRLYKAIQEKSVNNSPTERYFDGGYEYAFEKLFGLHNLTSDAEGEEMLTVSRKEIQQLVATNDKLIKKHPGRDSIEAVQAKTVNTILNRLFGSKCLPDEVSEVKRTLSENLSEPKPAEPAEVAVAENATTTQNPTEPKFRLKDKVVRKNVSTIRTIVGIDSVSDETGTSYYYMTEDSHGNNRMDFVESDLEPYIEPTENPNPSNSGELKSQEADKHFDNIIKDSLSKERRLNIATTIIERIIKSEYYSLSEKYREDNIKEMVKVSLQITDAIMAECEKGGGR
jgi:hypothetical protein